MTSLSDMTIGDGDPCVVAVTGEIDLSNARLVGDELLAGVPTEAEHVVLDLSGVRYMDSSGISLLFEVLRALQTRRQRLALVIPDPSPVRRMIELTRVDTVIVVRKTLDEAVASFADER